MNVIDPRVLYLEESPESLIQHLVQPELYLLIRVVYTLGCLLMDIRPEELKSKNILKRGY